MSIESPPTEPQRGEKPLELSNSGNVSGKDAISPQNISAAAAYKRVFAYATPYERSLQAVALAAALASGTAISLQALVFGDFITMINNFVLGVSTPAKFRGNVSNLVLYFVYLGIARFFLSFIFNYLFTYAAHRVVRTLRYEFLQAALRQEIGYYDVAGGGSIATQGASHGRTIQAGLSENLGMFIQATAAFIAAFAIALSRQWKLTLICICIAPATLVVMGVVGAMQSAQQGKIMGIYMQAGAFAEEILGSVRTIHAFSIQQRLVRKYDGFLASAHELGKKLSPLFGALFSCQFSIFQLGLALGFWQGIRMIANGEVEDSGDVFIVLMSVILAATNLTSIAPLIVDFSKAGLSASELFGLIDRQSLINPLSSQGMTPEATEGSLTFDNVGFAYPTRPNVQVLSGFTLDIPAGKTTALVGPSGSGKSTIVGLVERWYSPGTGDIKLDGIPIDQLNLNWLRSSARLVQQEPVLFQGTVYDNIRHGLAGTQWENAAQEEQSERIHIAAKQAFAHDFITELPQGYATFVGQRGGLLSGGQKQRIAIARSIISDPKILLLDEATSALDPHAEKVVQEALDRASVGRTTIIIAHKLSTVRRADNIVVMRKGHIVEQGTHEDLLAREGTYSHLVRIQDLTSAGADGENLSDENVADSRNELEKPLTLAPSSVVERPHADMEKYDYEQHNQMGIMAVFCRIIKDHAKLLPVFLLALAACVGGAAVYPGQAMLMASTIEVFTERDPSEMVRQGDFYASMFIVLAGGCLVSYFVLGFATNVIAQETSHRYRKQGLKDALRQDIQFFDREANSAGALSSRLDGYATNIMELTSFKIGLIIISVLNLLACSALALAHSWKLGLVVVLAGLPPLVVSGYLKIRIEATQDRQSSQRYSKSASLASESIFALRTVASLGIEKRILQRYSNDLDEAVSGTTRPLCWVMLCFGFMQAVEFWFLALGFWYGCRLLSFGEVTMYNFMVAFLSVFLAGQAAAVLFQFTTNVTAGLNGANYLFWLNSLEPSIQENAENRNYGPGDDHSLHVSKIHFSYPSRSSLPVLRGIDLKIPKGHFVGLVGASGCGKSTMIAMLERFYDPSRGEIIIGSSSHTELSPNRYRSVMGLVQQEPTLFTGTIRDNVSYGLELVGSPHGAEADDGSIERALRAANAWDFTCSLPSGLDTSVGSNGTQLSGGQRQRIAIARALIRKPRILLLDEATSALDTESERVVQDALSKAATEEEDRITIAIAHRLSTIRHADLICVFFSGRIVEMGTHDELFRMGGMYHKMCEAQALD